MSNQLQITGGAKVRNLEGVITGTSGVLGALPINTASGIPQLDSNGKILVSQLPNSVMEFLGVWNASTNTPYLHDGTGNAGDVYLCNVAGTVNFGSGPITFSVGDYVVYTGSVWARSSGATGTVTSVAISESSAALNITGSPITTSGTINIGFAGTSAQYVAGDGSLITFPALTGYVPYTGATGDVNLGLHDLYTSKVWLYDNPNSGYGSMELTDGVLHFEDVDGHSMVTMEDGYMTIANGSTIRGLLNVSGLTSNRDYAFPNASGTLALTSDLSAYVPTSRTISTTSPLQGGGDLSANRTLTILQSSSTQSGYLSSTDWNTFNNKETSLTFYSPLRRIGSSITIDQSNSTTNGYLSSTDWNTFNNKLSTATAASTYVPYTGATGAVNLGFNSLTTNSINLDGNSASGALNIKSNTTLTTAGASYVSLVSGNVNQLSIWFGAGNIATFTAVSLSTSRTYTLPDASGTLALTSQLTGGTVTSVAMSVPTGLSVSGSPITSSGTLAVSFATGYSIPTTASQTNWDTAYTNRITSATSPLSITSNVLSISQASGSTSGYLSSTDWTTFNSKQGAITLTTTGTSGAATLVGSTLNIPQYQAAGTYVTSVTGTSPIVSSGGTTPAISITQATTSTNGYLSSTDWNTFNGKQNALTNPVTGTGTSGQVTYFNGTSSVTGSNNLKFDGTNLSIGNPSSPLAQLHVYNASAAATILLQTNSTTDYSEIAVRNNSSTATSYFRQYSTATTGSDFGISRAGLALFFSNYATNFAIGTRNGGDLILGTADTERARILASNGYVGINTSSPSYLLDVNGTGRFGGTSTYNGFLIGSHSNNVGAAIYNKGLANATLYADSASTVLNAETNLYLRTGNTDRLTIASTGAATFSSSVTAATSILNSSATTMLYINTTNASGASNVYQQNGTNVGWIGNGSSSLIGGSTTDFTINGQTNINFAIGGYGKMLLNSTGKFLIGTTTDAGGELQVLGQIRARGGTAGLYFQNQASTNNFAIYGNTSIYFYNSDVGLISSIHYATGVYTPLSDFNKKKDFEDSTIGLNAILGLKPTLYRMKSDDTEGNKELGFIAQEVNEFIPQAFVESGDEDNKFIGLNYNAITATLVKAIQEQQKQIEELKAKIK